MTTLRPIRKEAPVASDAFGAGYLQRKLDRGFPLAPHIGISVIRADDEALVLCAPFAPNSNDKGTAFGGAVFCVAVLAGWAWVTRFIDKHGLGADTVIQESTIQYLKPVTGEFQASLEAPPSPKDLAKFLKMMERSGKGRIHLGVEVRDGRTHAARFDGVYVATARP